MYPPPKRQDLPVYSPPGSYDSQVYSSRGAKTPGDEYTGESTLIGLQKSCWYKIHQEVKTTLWFIHGKSWLAGLQYPP